MNDPNESGGGNGGAPLSDADKTKLAESVSGALSEAAQKAAQQAALREAQMRAIYAQRREALAGIILNKGSN